MMSQRYPWVIAAGAAFASFAISDVRQSIAAPTARQSDVIVANDISQPVPVAVVGTPTVQVTGTVPVSGFPAVQQVAGNVTATLAPGAAVKTITNDAQQTVTAKASGANTELDGTATSGEGPLTFLIGSTVTNTLPSGKRLVIETLSANVEVPPTQAPGEVEVISGNSIVYLPVQRVGTAPGGAATYAATVPARMYIDSSATFFWTRSVASGSAFLSLTASGYLVDL
jgi:hypothetical protein